MVPWTVPVGVTPDTSICHTVCYAHVQADFTINLHFVVTEILFCCLTVPETCSPIKGSDGKDDKDNCRTDQNS